MGVRTRLPDSVRRAVALREGIDSDGLVPCHWCGVLGRVTWMTRAWVWTSHEWDHVVPLDLGGTHDPDNVVLACRRCNRSRKNRLGPPPYLARIHSDLPETYGRSPVALPEISRRATSGKGTGNREQERNRDLPVVKTVRNVQSVPRESRRDVARIEDNRAS